MDDFELCRFCELFLFSRFVKFVKLIFGGKSVNIPLEKVNARTERFFWGGGGGGHEKKIKI